MGLRARTGREGGGGGGCGWREEGERPGERQAERRDRQVDEWREGELRSRQGSTFTFKQRVYIGLQLFPPESQQTGDRTMG